jgi:hypothetical protein
MMTRLITLVCLALVCVSSPALSQTGGLISLTGTADGSVCSIIDTSPGSVEVHIIVFNVIGLNAIQFAAPKPNCWTGATWVSDNIPTPVTIGDTQDTVIGLAIAWGGLCLDGPAYVGSMTFSTLGNAPPCCSYPILKATGDLHPEIDGPIAVLCSDPQHVAGVTANAVINPESQCACVQPVPVEESTWGAIKALYN